MLKSRNIGFTLGIYFATLIASFSQSPPNMIIFISDDQSQIDAGCYGNTDVATPNLDKLASEGMKFTSAYAASSMCTPSRSAMYTGLYPFGNGCQLNHYAIKPGVRTLPEYLKELGYRVVLAGKTHVNPESAFPFEYIAQDMGKYTPVSGRGDKKGETVQFIKEYFTEEKDARKPLCLIIATWWPHVPWLSNKDFDPEKFKVPAYLVDTRETRDALANYYQSIVEADNLLGRVMKAVDEAGEKDKTLFMYFSDQGVQFPGAKWTAYDQGLRVPFVVRWPEKVEPASVSDALITLTDLTPTLVDIAGGKPADNLDGKSFADVFLGKKKSHHDYIFAETSVEPHFWYNYTPARSVIVKGGLHYIRNYNPGVRFITHIDAFIKSNSYFNSWIEKADTDKQAAFLLNRYGYRPAEELYHLKEDGWEFNNLAGNPENKDLALLRKLLDKELKRQGETSEMIIQGQQPLFYSNAYEIRQGVASHVMAFDKKKWEPECLYVTGFVEGLDQPGVLFRYFNQFTVSLEDRRISVAFDNRKTFKSELLNERDGHILMRVSDDGTFDLKVNGREVAAGKVAGSPVKINGGYVSVGHLREGAMPAGMPLYFRGAISGMRFSMNHLNGEH